MRGFPSNRNGAILAPSPRSIPIMCAAVATPGAPTFSPQRYSAFIASTGTNHGLPSIVITLTRSRASCAIPDRSISPPGASSNGGATGWSTGAAKTAWSSCAWRALARGNRARVAHQYAIIDRGARQVRSGAARDHGDLEPWRLLLGGAAPRRYRDMPAWRRARFGRRRRRARVGQRLDELFSRAAPAAEQEPARRGQCQHRNAERNDRARRPAARRGLGRYRRNSG